MSRVAALLSTLPTAAARAARSSAPSTALAQAKRITSLQAQQTKLSAQFAQVRAKMRQPGGMNDAVMAKREQVQNKLEAVEGLLKKELGALMNQHGGALAPQHRALEARIAEKQSALTDISLKILVRTAGWQPTARLETSSAKLGAELKKLQEQQAALERTVLSSVLSPGR